MIKLKQPVLGKLVYLDKGGISSQYFAENYQWYHDNAGTNGHDGLDIATFKGDSIFAAHDGKVVNARWTQHGGYAITIVSPKQDDGTYIATLYAHNNELLVKEGDQVKAGDLIATMGNTGDWCFGVHSHFAVFLFSDPVPDTQQLSYPTGDSYTRLNFNNGWKGALNPLFCLENSPMQYVIINGKEQYLLFAPLKLAFNIGDPIELKTLTDQGLSGSPIPMAVLPEGYVDYPLVKKDRIKESVVGLIQDLFGIQ